MDRADPVVLAQLSALRERRTDSRRAVARVSPGRERPGAEELLRSREDCGSGWRFGVPRWIFRTGRQNL